MDLPHQHMHHNPLATRGRGARPRDQPMTPYPQPPRIPVTLCPMPVLHAHALHLDISPTTAPLRLHQRHPPCVAPPPCPDCPSLPGSCIRPGHTYMPRAHVYAPGTVPMHLGRPQALVTSLVCVIHTICTPRLPTASSHEPMLPVHTGLRDHVPTSYIDPPLHANAPCRPHSPPSHPDALHPSGDLPHSLPGMSCGRPHPPHVPYIQTASHWPPVAAPMRVALHGPPLRAPRVPLHPRASLRPHTWTTSRGLHDPTPSRCTSTSLVPPVAWGL